MAGAEVRITPYRNGPYLVRGAFVLTDQDGNEIESSRRVVALCRCGRSKIRPFCDGTHKAAGFRAESAPPQAAQRGGGAGQAAVPVTGPAAQPGADREP